MAAAKQEKGARSFTLLTEGVSRGWVLAALLEQPMFWWCLGPTPQTIKRNINDQPLVTFFALELKCTVLT